MASCELRRQIRKVCSGAPVNAVEFTRHCVSGRFLGCISSVDAMLWNDCQTRAHRANGAMGARPHVPYPYLHLPYNHIAIYH